MSASESQAPASRAVPASEVVELAPRASDIACVVFVLNEGERFTRQVERMSRYAGLVDLVVADGGSTDGSVDPARLAADGVRAILVKRGPGALSAQMRMAFDWALRQGYAGVIVVDGNGKDDVTAIPRFVDELRAGVDHVQGSRYVPGGQAINTPLSRHLGLRLVHAPLLTLVTGRRHTDSTNGFRAYSARLLSDPEVDVFRDVFSSYELHYHLDIESTRSSRFRSSEIPVTRSYPAKGAVPTKISPVRGNLKILRILFSAALGRYRTRRGGS